MQTNTTTADQFISNTNATNAAATNNTAATAKRYTDNLVTGKTKVPVPIMIICILGLGGLILQTIGMLMGWSLFAFIGTFFLIYHIAAMAAGFLSIIWMLQMKKKGAYLYAGLFVAGAIVSIIYGVFAVSIAFIIAAIVTGIALYYSKQMK